MLSPAPGQKAGLTPAICETSPQVVCQDHWPLESVICQVAVDRKSRTAFLSMFKIRMRNWLVVQFCDDTDAAILQFWSCSATVTADVLASCDLALEVLSEWPD